jgi:hypothetical protein
MVGLAPRGHEAGRARTATDSSRARGLERARPWLTAAALLAGLVGIHEASGAARPRRLVYQGEAKVRDLTAKGPEALEDVFYTRPFEVARPARLTLALSRGVEPRAGAPRPVGDANGWLGVEYALVDLGTGEVREGGVEPGATSDVVIDRVEPGRYVVRLLAAWDPRGTLGPARAPEALDLRVFVGGRPWYELWVVAAVLLSPLAVARLRASRASR